MIQVKADLKTEALPMLNKIGKILSKYADDNIEIEGHTDFCSTEWWQNMKIMMY